MGERIAVELLFEYDQGRFLRESEADPSLIGGICFGLTYEWTKAFLSNDFPDAIDPKPWFHRAMSAQRAHRAEVSIPEGLVETMRRAVKHRVSPEEADRKRSFVTYQRDGAANWAEWAHRDGMAAPLGRNGAQHPFAQKLTHAARLLIGPQVPDELTKYVKDQDRELQSIWGADPVVLLLGLRTRTGAGHAVGFGMSRWQGFWFDSNFGMATNRSPVIAFACLLSQHVKRQYGPAEVSCATFLTGRPRDGAHYEALCR